MAKIVVYTAIFGSVKDRLRPPENWPEDPDLRLVCFTDQQKRLGKIKGWELRKPLYKQPNARRTARQHKILAHELFPTAEWTMWIDGCLTPKVSPQEIVDNHSSKLISTFKHQERTCVYQELQACLRLKKDAPELMRQQIKQYKNRGYPPYNGLAETTAMLRKNHPTVAKVNNAWWEEINKGSLRDQLSFDYVMWKLKLNYGHLPGGRTKSKYFHYRPHR